MRFEKHKVSRYKYIPLESLNGTIKSLRFKNSIFALLCVSIFHTVYQKTLLKLFLSLFSFLSLCILRFFISFVFIQTSVITNITFRQPPSLLQFILRVEILSQQHSITFLSIFIPKNKSFVSQIWPNYRRKIPPRELGKESKIKYNEIHFFFKERKKEKIL